MLSIQMLLRYGPRVKRILTVEDLHVAFKGLSPVISARIEAFEAAHQQVIKEEEMASKEKAEAIEAVEALRREMDIVRVAAQPSLPHVDLGPASIAYSTHDDLFAGAEQMEDILTEEGDTWSELRDSLAGKLESALKEYGESVSASASLQKSREARRVAALEFSSTLVDFRRLVRVVFGSKSEEYHSLRVRRRKSEEE